MRKRIQEANTRHGRYRKAARESRRYIRELAPQRVQETAADLGGRPLRFLDHAAIDNGQAWVQSQRDHYWPEARRLTAAEKTGLSPFLKRASSMLLGSPLLPRIENPPFYRELEAQGDHGRAICDQPARPAPGAQRWTVPGCQFEPDVPTGA